MQHSVLVNYGEPGNEANFVGELGILQSPHCMFYWHKWHGYEVATLAHKFISWEIMNNHIQTDFSELKRVKMNYVIKRTDVKIKERNTTIKSITLS